MKKKLIVSLAVLLLIFTCVAISAADLETVDEGNYTISVPADVTFKDVGILPAGVSIYFSSSGFMDSIENAMIDGKQSKSEKLLYYYVDFTKDPVANLTSLNSTDALFSLIENNTGVEQDSPGDYKVFKFATSSNDTEKTDYKYEIVVQDKGLFSLFPQQRAVVLNGNDLDLLTEMADSVEFK